MQKVGGIYIMFDLSRNVAYRMCHYPGVTQSSDVYVSNVTCAESSFSEVVRASCIKHLKISASLSKILSRSFCDPILNKGL